MALEIVDGNIRFVWDNGGGPGIISKSLLHGVKKKGPKWFKIIVERCDKQSIFFCQVVALTRASIVSVFFFLQG